MAHDYIIIGGGSAGCVLANRLSEDPSISVLLIEAGGPDTNMLFRMPAGFAKMTKGIASWGWSTVPQKHLNGRVIWYTQAKVVGGGSSINAQLYTRGNAKDYDAWVREAGCEGWSYRDVLPYFKRSEDNQRLVNDYHGYGGPLGVSYPVNPLPISFAFLRAAQEAGIPFNDDFNGAVQDGIGHYQLTTRNAERSSTASAYLGPARSRQNLTVRLNTPTLKIRVENRRAVGVEVGISGGIETLRAEREVILSSGAIGSPRLLQLSGIGPADALAAAGVPVVHDLPGVGANMQDHLNLYAICECTGDHTYDRVAQPHRTVWAGLQYLLFKTGPVTSTLFETGGFWYADREARSPDIQFHLGLGSGIEAGVAAMRNPGVTLNSAFLRPRSRGSASHRSQLLVRYVRPGVLAEGPAACPRHPQPASAETIRASRAVAGRGHQERRRPDAICLPVLQDGSSSCRHLRHGLGRECRHDARPKGPRHGRPTCRRRFSDAARPFVQYKRTDDHGRGEGVRCHPRSQTAAGGDFLTVLCSADSRSSPAQ